MNNVVSYTCNDLLVFWVKPYNINHSVGYVWFWNVRRVGIVREQISTLRTMKGRWLWIALCITLVIALLWNVRERFGPSAAIEEPQFMAQYGMRFYNPTVQTKLFNLLDSAGKQRLIQIIGAEQNAKEMLGYLGTKFYDEVYAPANTPITDQQLDQWTTINSGPDIKPDVTTVLKKYFIDQPSAPTPAFTGVNPSVTEPTEPYSDPTIPKTYNEQTITMLLNLLPPFKQEEFKAMIGEAAVREYIKWGASVFYWRVYRTATAPITEDQIDQFLSSEGGGYFVPVREQLKPIMKTYFIQGYSMSFFQAPPPTSPPTTSTDDPNSVYYVPPTQPTTSTLAIVPTTTSAPAPAPPVTPASTSGVQEPTEDVQGMPFPKLYNSTEGERIYNLLTPGEKSEWLALYNQNGNPNPTQNEEILKRTINFVASGFYWYNYKLGNVPTTIDGIQSTLVGKVEPGTEKRFATILKRYFVDQGSTPSGMTLSTGGTNGMSGTPSTGGTNGMSGTPSTGETTGGGDRLRQVFGPLYTSIGSGGLITDDSTTTSRYPELLGGGGNGVPKKNEDEKGAMPTIGGLGGLGSSRFFPFSRVPGDMEKIPDPYRVSQTFTAANYSFKTDPVPFLTDFSAFFK